MEKSKLKQKNFHEINIEINPNGDVFIVDNLSGGLVLIESESINRFIEIITKDKEKVNSSINIKPRHEPPYSCPSDNECQYPNCGCSWNL